MTILGAICLTWNMPLLTLNYCLQTCGSPEVITSTTILRNVVKKPSYGRRECHIMETQIGLPIQQTARGSAAMA